MITTQTSVVKSLHSKLAVIAFFAMSLFLFGNKSVAQQSKNNLDVSVRRMLERNLTFPESLFKGENGIALLLVSKAKDSIIIKSLYASYKDYNFEMDQNLTAVANRKGVPVKLDQSELIVPVIYHYFDEQHTEPDLTLTPAAKKFISQMGRQIDVNTPVVMVGGPR